jgi:hypothetical protein
MSIPGFNAMASIHESGITGTGVSGNQAVLNFERGRQAARIIPALPPPGWHPGVTSAECLALCRYKGGTTAHCEQICPPAIAPGGGLTVASGGGSGASGGPCWKNPTEGALCCEGLFMACALACGGTAFAIGICEAACIVGAAACANCQVWPCNQL